MRIGFFTDYYLPSHNGVAYSAHSFREQLEKLGHEVFVFAPAPSLRYKETDPQIIRFPAIKGLFVESYQTSLFFPPQQVKRIEQLKLDIIHFHTPIQIGLLGAHVALKNDIPLVYTYHTDILEYLKIYPGIFAGTIALSIAGPFITGGGLKDAPRLLRVMKPDGGGYNAWKKGSTTRVMTILHNYCDAVIVPSHKMQSQLLKWHSTTPITILPTGVDKITSKPTEITAFRKRFELLATDKVVMFVGRLGKEKNIDLLVRSFAQIAKKEPHAKLLLVGDFKYAEALSKLAAVLGVADRMRITGYIDNHQLGSLYACGNVFAFPSKTDTQGLVLNEAAHAGLPLVIVDPQVSEVIKDGQNGYITKPTIKAFSSAISKLLQDDTLAEQMGRQSVLLARKFSESAQAKKLETLYQQVIEQHHSRPW